MNRTKLSLFGGGASNVGSNRASQQGNVATRAVPDHLSGLTPIERAFVDTLAKAPARA